MATTVFLDREAEQFACFDMEVRIRQPPAWLVVPRKLLPPGTLEVRLDEVAQRLGYAVEVTEHTEYLVMAMVRRR